MTFSSGEHEFRIRPMGLEDVARVHEIDVLSFSMPWPERSYRFEVTENDHSSNWVVDVRLPDGTLEVVAMMVNWVILDEIHIATIAVHPDYRRLKLGRRLLARGLLAGWDRGGRTALLEVRKSNLAAQTLYFEFGFVVAGERLRYYQDNHEDALLLTLDPIDPERVQGLGALPDLANL